MHVILCSPLQRARDTAQLAGVQAEPVDDLRELDYGEYEGLTTVQIREAVPGWTVFTHPLRGGETLDAAAARVDRVIAEAASGDGDTLLVAHGHILRILAARWLAQPPAFGARLRLDTATASVLGHERETRVLLRWNAR
jgi:broad specificity phosphatase PhoE